MGSLQKIIFTSLFSLFLFGFIVPTNLIHAAEVPKNTVLAKTQILNVGLGDNPPTLDPQRIEDTISSRVAYDLFEGLMTEAEDGTITPGVAERYELSPDGKTYTFYIRKNAKFSDGSSILASDVAFSLRRVVDPKTASTYSFIAYPIVNAAAIVDGKKKPESLGVEIVNSSTVRVKLEQPVPYFLNLMAMTTFAILKESSVNKNPSTFTQPGKLVSSGAYALTYWKVGDRLTAVKNKYYWNQAKTIVETVNYYPVVDANSELQMYSAGQIDFSFIIPSDKMKSLRASIPNQVKVYPQLAIYYLDLNMRKAPFKNNPKLRQALSMAVDRDILTKSVLGRGEISAYDLVPNKTLNYKIQNYEWASWNAQKRTEEAQKLFSESGYSAENPLKITISYNTDINHKKVTLAVASMWQKTFGKMGLSVELENQEWKVFLKTRQQGEYLVARDGWVADYNDASTFTNLLATGNPQNNSGYSNTEYDKIQEQASVETDLAKRGLLFEKGMVLALNEYPIIPLYDYVTAHLVKPFVGGYTGANPLDHIYTRNLYIIEK